MKDHEIIELYWARNESAITATTEKYGNYCHMIAYNILRNKEAVSNGAVCLIRRKKPRDSWGWY